MTRQTNSLALDLGLDLQVNDTCASHMLSTEYESKESILAIPAMKLFLYAAVDDDVQLDSYSAANKVAIDSRGDSSSHDHVRQYNAI